MEKEGLCTSCAGALIIKGAIDTMIICNATRPAFEIPFLVESCSGYEENHKLAGLSDMEDLALEIKIPRTNHRAGFKR